MIFGEFFLFGTTFALFFFWVSVFLWGQQHPDRGCALGFVIGNDVADSGFHINDGPIPIHLAVTSGNFDLPPQIGDPGLWEIRSTVAQCNFARPDDDNIAIGIYASDCSGVGVLFRCLFPGQFFCGFLWFTSI